MENPQHLLIIGFVWPEPNSSAAGARMLELISFFKLQQYKITFASAATDSEFMADLSGIDVEKVSIELNNNSFDRFVSGLKPTIVLFDRFMTEEMFGWRVAENCPDALRILDTEDLHCLRSARQLALTEKREFSKADLVSDMAKREIASILRCDVSLIISSFEMDLLQTFLKVDKALLFYLPFMLNELDEKITNEWLSFSERKHFICIGNFLHQPNWNAVLYLKESIWPLIREKLPAAQLHIYGAYPSQKVNALHNVKEGFYIMGRAESAQEVVSKAKVCLVPLRFGAGLKGKLVEAMQCGTPSVTTAIGAEAMHGELPWSGIIANTPQEIANAAVELYTNETLWNQTQLNGVKIINQLYSKTEHQNRLTSLISDLQLNLIQHRQQNFIGALLMHHSLQSTKYMSRWIEEKNRRN